MSNPFLQSNGYLSGSILVLDCDVGGKMCITMPHAIKRAYKSSICLKSAFVRLFDVNSGHCHDVSYISGCVMKLGFSL